VLWKAPLGAVLRAFCPCGLVRQALNYILRGVRIGADRVKITLFFRGAERVHVPTIFLQAGREFSSSLSALHLHFLKGTLGVKRSTFKWAALRECGSVHRCLVSLSCQVLQ